MEKNELHLFICLVTAHLIGDFLLQSKYVAFKKHKLTVLLYHGFIIAILSYILSGVWNAWFIFVFIFITHSVIDYYKTKINKQGAAPFLLDQFIHIVMIGVLISLMNRVWGISQGDDSIFWVDLLGISILKIMTVVSGLICAIRVGEILIGFMTQPLEEQMIIDDWIKNRGFRYGSRLIGKLERVMILLLFLIDQPMGIGFLITAKSILRFEKISDSQNRMESEYVIIGTLLSFVFGIVTGYVTVYVLKLLV